MSDFYIGLMSGTSVDGIDAGLVEFNNDKINLIAFEYLAFSDEIKSKIQHISTAGTPILLQDYGGLDTQLGYLFAEITNKLLNKANKSPSSIRAIGSHGHTIYHDPNSDNPFSLQIGDPNIIAEKTGITTIADFRRRDIASGGQGAPLVPAFHQAFFGSAFDLSTQNIAIINIGGIANITALSNTNVMGFDTGTGNTLMDYWINKNLNIAYDNQGKWAESGNLNLKLLQRFKQDPYFNLNAPKSTGKEYFSPTWLNTKINEISCSPEDIQNTLCQLTADTISEAIQKYVPHTSVTLICGGGAHNNYLIHLIQQNLNHPVSSTQQYGIDPDHVEAIAFAWLARQSVNHLPGNLTEVTGAKSAVILGGIYPGSTLTI